MQKRLLALVATVAMVLSMFAGIAFAAPVPINTRVSTPTGTAHVNHADKIITVALNPADFPAIPNGATPAVTAKWFSAFVLAAPDTTYAVKSVSRDGKDLVVYPDGVPGLTAWRVAEANPYTMVYTVTWKDTTTPTPAADIVETWTFNYEPLPAGKVRAISLSTTKVISSYPSNGFQLISGSFPASNADYVVDVYKADGTTKINSDPIKAKGGTFSFYLPTELEPQDVKVKATLAGIVVAEGKVEVRYNVVTDPAKLEFVYTGEQSPVAITGKVTNSKGEPVVENTLVYLNGATKTYFVGVKTNAKGEFGYVVLEWEQAEELNLLVGTVPHVKGEVKAKAATLKVTPGTITHSLVGNQTIKLEGSGFEGLVEFDVSKLTGATVSPATQTAVDGKVEAVVTWAPEKAGSYTITAKSPSHTATVTVTVTNPASLNWMNVDLLDELEVGDNVIPFGKANNGVYVASYDGENTNAVDYKYVVSVDGKEKLNQREEAGHTVTITPTKLGTVTVKVVAYNGDKEVASRTFTAKVNGLDVDVDYTELTVNQKHTLTFVVKDADGVPVNNATVSFDGVVKVKPADVNIQNGTYVVKDFEPKVVKPVEVVIEGVKGAKATLTLDVVGDKVYTVTADVDALLQGKGQDVKLTVTKDGVAVMPQRVKWVYENGTSDEIHPTYLGDGVSKAKITAAKAGELIVRVENFDGTLCGEVTLEVVAPKLVLINEEAVNVTNNFKSEVNFKVVDPRDDSVIKDNLTIDSNHVTKVTVYDANDGLLADTVLGAEEHALTILAEATADDFKAADKEDEVAAISFKLGAITLDGVFEVKNATITSDPGMIVIGGQNNLTLTYEDANGQPIVGKKVLADAADLGKTDENGQVIYPAGIVAAAVTAKADTDVDAKFVTLSIKIGYDTEAPKVTWELDGNKANIVISDNVRLVRINIDGEEIDFWPGATHPFVRTLQPGVNKFHIKAQDSNDNVFNEVVEIEYVTDAVVLEGDLVARQGAFTFVQARQFEELGAEFEWDNASKTATFVIGETTVEVTIGSTTAKVNGEAVTMPAAPYIENNRTYVPIRFISESLGWNVDWAVGDIITISL